ncbi:hypothetical protein SKAU_G00103680 [Synaphobranchus kaupii]|uniref:Uncharacterized protein n=1 Tax=Synaphobranchus kaupii TaxID=118154 RepID=A0A9Q1FZ28_SYNKA|nr:hypothetical protein SKAU_G00103680 [Synaphobranchus kaupii]
MKYTNSREKWDQLWERSLLTTLWPMIIRLPESSHESTLHNGTPGSPRAESYQGPPEARTQPGTRATELHNLVRLH